MSISLLLLNWELRIEKFDVIPSLTTSSSVWKNLQHLVFNIWHFFESLYAKCYKKMINNFLFDSFWHVVDQLSNASLNFIFDRHLFKFVASRLQSFIHCFIFILLICIVFLFFALNNRNNIKTILMVILTLIFSSWSLILIYSLLISQYSDMFFFNS